MGFLLSEPCSEAAGRRYLGVQTGSSALWAATMLKEKQLHLRAGAGAGAGPTSTPIQPSPISHRLCLGLAASASACSQASSQHQGLKAWDQFGAENLEFPLATLKKIPSNVYFLS